MGLLDDLQHAGVEAFRSGDYETALAKFQALVDAATAENDLSKRAEALNDLGVIRKQLDDLPGAFEALEAALAYYQEVDDRAGEGRVLGNMGMVEEAMGKYDDAVQSYVDSAAIFEELGESELAMYGWQSLSRLRMRRKEWISAISAYEEGISHLPDNSFKKKMLQKLLKFPYKFVG